MSQIVTPICEDGVSKPLDRLQLDEHELVRVTFESAPGREAEPLPPTADTLANLRVSTDIPDPAGIAILGCTAKLYSTPRPTIGRLTTSLVGAAHAWQKGLQLIGIQATVHPGSVRPTRRSGRVRLPGAGPDRTERRGTNGERRAFRAPIQSRAEARRRRPTVQRFGADARLARPASVAE